MAALLTGPERGFTSEWTSRWAECDRRLLVRRTRLPPDWPPIRLGGRGRLWHHRAESSWCVSDPAGGWSRTSAQPDRSGGPYSAGVADCVCCRHGRQRLGSLRDPAVAQADGGRPAEQGCTTSRGGLPSGQGHQMPCGEPHGGPEPSPEQLVGERLCWDASPESLFGEGVGDAHPCGDGDRTRTGSPRVRQPSVARAPRGGARRTTAASGRGVGSICSGSRQSSARAGVRGSRRPTSSRCPSRWRSRLGSRVQRPTAASTQRRPPSWPEASPLASLWRELDATSPPSDVQDSPLDLLPPLHNFRLVL